MFKKIFENKYAPFTAVFLMFLGAMSFVKLMTYADDTYYSTAVSCISEAFAFAADQYIVWSGRFFANLLSVIIMKENIWLWRVLNAAVFTSLLLGMYLAVKTVLKIDSAVKRWSVPFFIVFALFAANLRAVKWGAFWVTGSFSYLWPAAAMVFILWACFLLLDKKDIPGKYLWFLIPLAITGSVHEQAGAVISTFLLISCVYYFISSRRWSTAGLILLAFSVLSFAAAIFAPANSIRFEREVADWYPVFNDLALWQKILSGFSYTVLYNLFIKTFPVYFLISACAAYMILKGDYSRWIKFLALVPPVYLTVCFLYNILFPNYFAGSLFFNFQEIAYEFKDNKNGLSYMSVPLGIFIVLLIPFLFYRVFGSGTVFLKCFLLYFASLFSSFMVSFSPTVFGSGERIFFVGNVLLAVLTGIIFFKAAACSRIKIKKYFFS